MLVLCVRLKVTRGYDRVSPCCVWLVMHDVWCLIWIEEKKEADCRHSCASGFLVSYSARKSRIQPGWTQCVFKIVVSLLSG